jgi:hypothetical protein
VQILSYLRAFGELGYKANTTDKKRASMARGNKRTGVRGIAYFVGKPGGGRLPLGVWQRIGFGAAGSAIKPVIIFASKPTYRQQLDVPGIAKRTIEQHFADELGKAVAQAERTALPRPAMVLI